MLDNFATTAWTIVGWFREHPEMAAIVGGAALSRVEKVRERCKKILHAPLDGIKTELAMIRSENMEALVLGLFNQALLEHRIDQSRVSDRVVKLDKNGALLWGSARMFDFTGFEIEDLYGPSFVNVFDNGDRRSFEAVIERAMKYQSIIDARLHIRTASGAVVAVRLRGRPVVMNDSPIGAVCHIEDAAA